MGYILINSAGKTRRESFFDTPILARMKCQYGDASARIQAARKMTQKCFQRGELRR